MNEEQKRLAWAIQTMREARYATLADTENVHAPIHALEHVARMEFDGLNEEDTAPSNSFSYNLTRLGRILSNRHYLYQQEYKRYQKVARAVSQARNNYVHTGAMARNLVRLLLDLLILIEDACLRGMPETVETYMVPHVIRAEVWQPLRIARLNMLNHSFTSLPIQKENRWYFVNDTDIARILTGISIDERRIRLEKRMDCQWDDLEPTSANQTTPNTEISEIVDMLKEGPMLVFENMGDKHNLSGIITAFDLL